MFGGWADDNAIGRYGLVNPHTLGTAGTDQGRLRPVSVQRTAVALDHWFLNRFLTDQYLMCIPIFDPERMLKN